MMSRECHLMSKIILIEEILDKQHFPSCLENEYKAMVQKYRAELADLLKTSDSVSLGRPHETAISNPHPADDSKSGSRPLV